METDIDWNTVRGIEKLYLFGWKAVAKYCGVSIRTLKRWHYNKCRLPFYRGGSMYGNGATKICVPVHAVDMWIKFLNKISKQHGPIHFTGTLKNVTRLARG